MTEAGRRSRLGPAVVAGFCCLLSSPCWAGAWTLAPGTGQVIARFAYSEARHRYGGGGNAEERGDFYGRGWSLYGEAGLLEGLTLVGDLQTREEVDKPGRGLEARRRRTQGAAGVRLRIGEGKRAAFSLEASAGYGREENRSTGGTEEGFAGSAGVRLGRSWGLFGRPAYWEVHFRRQWSEIVSGRNAYHADFGFGWRPAARVLVTGDLFSRVETGGAAGRGRETLAQLALVYDAGRAVSVEAGARRTLGGANTERQTVFFAGLWFRY